MKRTRKSRTIEEWASPIKKKREPPTVVSVPLIDIIREIRSRLSREEREELTDAIEDAGVKGQQPVLVELRLLDEDRPTLDVRSRSFRWIALPNGIYDLRAIRGTISVGIGDGASRSEDRS
jgi:hypothetical protein